MPATAIPGVCFNGHRMIQATVGLHYFSKAIAELGESQHFPISYQMLTVSPPSRLCSDLPRYGEIAGHR